MRETPACAARQSPLLRRASLRTFRQAPHMQRTLSRRISATATTTWFSAGTERGAGRLSTRMGNGFYMAISVDKREPGPTAGVERGATGFRGTALPEQLQLSARRIASGGTRRAGPRNSVMRPSPSPTSAHSPALSRRTSPRGSTTSNSSSAPSSGSMTHPANSFCSHPTAMPMVNSPHSSPSCGGARPRANTVPNSMISALGSGLALRFGHHVSMTFKPSSPTASGSRRYSHIQAPPPPLPPPPPRQPTPIPPLGWAPLAGEREAPVPRTKTVAAGECEGTPGAGKIPNGKPQKAFLFGKAIKPAGYGSPWGFSGKTAISTKRLTC